ncbi:hypothetical protein NUW54_g9629 [Trametes sanguinea]|uniref:Uncharacterized protein n=1 Tax=Trametes sanguinea TaxID=158606 RepID=A0ACC1P5T2_9APHY|nr:hypothetical protein NUW54_g9629 [Trametes sanguinea]
MPISLPSCNDAHEDKDQNQNNSKAQPLTPRRYVNEPIANPRSSQFPALRPDLESKVDTSYATCTPTRRPTSSSSRPATPPPPRASAANPSRSARTTRSASSTPSRTRSPSRPASRPSAYSVRPGAIAMPNTEADPLLAPPEACAEALRIDSPYSPPASRRGSVSSVESVEEEEEEDEA